MSAVSRVVILAGGLAGACGGNQQQNTHTTGSKPMPASTPAPSAAATASVYVTFQSQPDPPRTGENTFEVRVISVGQPVTDAEVSAEFFMAAMPDMKMPEMTNTVALKHQGGGWYRGIGNLMMAGRWDVMVRVRRGGQEIGSRKVIVTAK
jgi:hypothetical protein